MSGWWFERLLSFEHTAENLRYQFYLNLLGSNHRPKQQTRNSEAICDEMLRFDAVQANGAFGFSWRGQKSGCMWGWVKTYYYHILRNNHTDHTVHCPAILGSLGYQMVPGFWHKTTCLVAPWNPLDVASLFAPQECLLAKHVCKECGMSRLGP